MKEIYLIDRIWLDSLENDTFSAVGYGVFGFVTTEEEAKEFCSKGKLYTKKDCWAIFTNMPEYRYRKVEKLFI